MRKILYLIWCCCLWGACSSGSDGAPSVKVDFTYTPKAENPNTLVFKAVIEGEYQLLEWVFSGGATIKHVLETEYNFPKKGEYEVTLRIWNDGKSVDETKKITIKQDDPDYAGPRLVWSDEFDGSTLNRDFWTAETNVHVNNELQTYTADGNYSVAGGYLTITAKKVNENKENGSYTSARLITSGKKEFKYGRMEIRAKLPKGTGTWPAIWMLGSGIGTIGWPACGEIDIMEYVGYRPGVVQFSLHCPERNGGNSLTSTLNLPTEDEFHVYGLNWTKDKIECYVDDRNNPYYVYEPSNKTQANWPFDQPFFFILNVAIGGDWGGLQGVDNTIFPVAMVVDYVRVYANE